MHRMTLHGVCLLLLLVLAPVGAAAQSTATATTNATATATPVDSDRVAVYGDSQVWITDWRYHNETFHVTLLVEQYRPSVTLTAPDEPSEGGSARGYIVRQELTRGTHELSIHAPGGEVAVSTSVSTGNGFFTVLRADEGGSVLVPGPFNGTDTRNAGIGGALGVSIFVFKMAYDAVYGSSEGGERLA